MLEAQYRQLFIDKVQKDITAIQSLLSPPGISDLKTLRRYFHNIKSDSAMMGYHRVSSVCADVEHILEFEIPDETRHAIVEKACEILKDFITFLKNDGVGANFASSKLDELSAQAMSLIGKT